MSNRTVLTTDRLEVAVSYQSQFHTLNEKSLEIKLSHFLSRNLKIFSSYLTYLAIILNPRKIKWKKNIYMYISHKYISLTFSYFRVILVKLGKSTREIQISSQTMQFPRFFPDLSPIPRYTIGTNQLVVVYSSESEVEWCGRQGEAKLGNTKTSNCHN